MILNLLEPYSPILDPLELGEIFSNYLAEKIYSKSKINFQIKIRRKHFGKKSFETT